MTRYAPAMKEPTMVEIDQLEKLIRSISWGPNLQNPPALTLHYVSLHGEDRVDLEVALVVPDRDVLGQTNRQAFAFSVAPDVLGWFFAEGPDAAVERVSAWAGLCVVQAYEHEIFEALRVGPARPLDPHQPTTMHLREARMIRGR